jgi:hypothetical protein
MFVKPVPIQPDDPEADPIPRIVRFEGRNPLILSQDGGEVPDTTYWWRRLRDGDVEVSEPTRKRAHRRTKRDEGHDADDHDNETETAEAKKPPETVGETS